MRSDLKYHRLVEAQLSLLLDSGTDLTYIQELLSHTAARPTDIQTLVLVPRASSRLKIYLMTHRKEYLYLELKAK